MNLPFADIQTMVFAQLDGAVVDIETVVVPVLDHVRQDQPYPYIVIGEFSSEFEWVKEDFAADLIRCVVPLQVFSEYSGTLEVNSILSQIYNLLSVPHLLALGGGFELVDIRATSSSVVSRFESGDELIVREGNIIFTVTVSERR